MHIIYKGKLIKMENRKVGEGCYRLLNQMVEAFGNRGKSYREIGQDSENWCGAGVCEMCLPTN